MSLWSFSRRRRHAKLKREEPQSVAQTTPKSQSSALEEAAARLPRKLSKKNIQGGKPLANLVANDGSAHRDFEDSTLSPGAHPARMDLPDFNTRLAGSSSRNSREDVTALPNHTECTEPPRRAAPAPPPQQSRDNALEQTRPETGRSGENSITALPVGDEPRNSPHLRAARHETADIPYDWRLHQTAKPDSPLSSSLTKEKSGKLQRNPSRNKRAAFDPPLAKRKPSKKRKDEHLREEEIRSVSAPIAIPRKPSRTDTGLMRRESRRMRAGLDPKLERPNSNKSFPPEDSLHSSMSATSESRNYRLSLLDIVAPRPAIRYTVSNPYSIYAQPSRGDSRMRNTSGKAVLEERARIDSLADDFDSTDLRELMDRDKRRKEKKRKVDIEKVQRKLQKRVDKLQAQELRDRELAEKSQDSANRLPSATTTQDPANSNQDEGLGIATFAPNDQLAPARAVDLDRQVEGSETMGAAELTFHMEDIVETSSSPAAALDAGNHSDQLGRDIIPRMPLLSSYGEDEDRHMETPFEELDEDSELPIARSVSYGQGRISSPSYSGNRTKASKILGEDVAMGNYSKVDKILGENVPRPLSETTVDSHQETMLPERKRSGMWSALFRRDRKSTYFERDRDSPSEASFSNTSRESMSRHLPPTHLYQPTSHTMRSTSAQSGTRVRTQSKFREDLPELPMSLETSRVESPDANDMVSCRANKTSNMPTDVADGRVSSPYENLTSRGRTDSPASGGRLSNLMSQSLASVDSEASWLSGKPHRMPSFARKHSSTGNASTCRTADEFSTSYEDLGVPDDDYFRRLNPSHVDVVRHTSKLPTPVRGSNKMSGSAVAPSSAISDTDDEVRSPPSPIMEGETKVRNGAGRNPTVVHREPRVKSSEGLLNQYLDADVAAEEAYMTPQDSPTRESHEYITSSMETTPLAHATSINLGKNHARRISAGSAKLFEIANRNSPTTSPTTPVRPTFI